MSRVAALLAVSLLGWSAENLAAQGPGPAPAWGITLGAIGLVLPEYPGSDELRVLPLPLVDITWKDRVYLGPSAGGVGGGIGFFPLRGHRMKLATELVLLDSRSPGRADALAGTESQDLLFAVGGALTYTAGPVALTVGAHQGINDGGGARGFSSVALAGMTGRFIITATLTATAADARQMRREFGVSNTEAARRDALIAAGDPRLRADEGGAYRPGTGLRSVGPALSLVRLLSPHWGITGFGGLDYLVGDAARSPLVRRRAVVGGGLGIGYRF